MSGVQKKRSSYFFTVNLPILSEKRGVAVAWRGRGRVRGVAVAWRGRGLFFLLMTIFGSDKFQQLLH